MKKITHGIASLFGKTVLVTAVVVLGFGLYGLLGFPAWGQGFALLPAGYVFCRLTGERIPRVRRWLPFLLGLTLLNILFSSIFPQVPEVYRTFAFVAFAVIAPRLLGFIPSALAQSRQEPPSVS